MVPVREPTPFERRYVDRLYAPARWMRLVLCTGTVVGAAPFVLDLWADEPVAGGAVALVALGGAYAVWRYLGRPLSVRPTRAVVALEGPLVTDLDADDPWGGAAIGGSRAVVPGPWRNHIGEGEPVRCEAVVAESPHRPDVAVVVRLAVEGGPELSVEGERGTGTPLDDPRPGVLVVIGALAVVVGGAFAAAVTSSGGRGWAGLSAWGAVLLGGSAFAVGAVLYEGSRRRFFELYGVSEGSAASFRRARRRRAWTVGGLGAALSAAVGAWFMPWWAAALYGATAFSMLGAYVPVRHPTFSRPEKEPGPPDPVRP